MANITVTNTFTNGTAADATQVNTNFTDIINGTSDGTKDFSISALTVGGTATLNGNVNLGNSSADDLAITASLASSLAIKTTFSYDIGAATLGLRALFLGSTDSTARTVKLAAPVVATSYTFTFPTSQGTTGQVLTSAGAAATPTWGTLSPPTVQSFTSGTSQTYTTPANAKWLRVRMVGGGGGGGGSGTANGTIGGTGGDTIFSTRTAGGGVGAQRLTGGAGGAASGSAHTLSAAFGGATGGGGGQEGTTSGSSLHVGGMGGGAAFGGAGNMGSAGSAGGAAVTNSGSGGGGAGGDNVNSLQCGGGGGAGAYVEFIIASPTASQTFIYSVGAAGAAGTAGTSGRGGGAGAAGYIVVEEFYQ